VHELTGIRDELLVARELLQWTATFPERVDGFGFPTALALGLQESVRRTLHTRARIEYASAIAALEEDARAVAEELGPQVKQALGIAAATPLTEAMWSQMSATKAWAKQELERARRLAEYQDPRQLAAEADEFRPDP
jgi:hypothetical protein